LNIIKNFWSIIDKKLLKFTISNTDELKNALQTVWSDISIDTIQKLFSSLPGQIQSVINGEGFACNS
jgi:hypothetical protein